MSFINDRFMINNERGIRLYREVAKDLPIIDYHCHLNAREIYENKPFKHISHLWLAGDHYKWRAMRANGIDESLITGEGSDSEKFRAWAETVEASFGNPLYHWTHLELSQYFSCDGLLNGQNWKMVMDHCNRLLKNETFRPRALISRSSVQVICTTDSPLDSLEYHRHLKNDSSFTTLVLPTFRPDDLFADDPVVFANFVIQLGETTGKVIKTFAEFSAAIGQRIRFFHKVGCRISDHGPAALHYQDVPQERINSLFTRKARGGSLTEQDNLLLNSAMFVMLAGYYKKHNWAMQLHFGAIRNNNSKMLEVAGINSGFDSIGDQLHLASGLNKLLDALNVRNILPRTIVYNLNASYNDVVASAIANFQTGESGIKSPIQFGSGWWFNDTRRGMENQLACLADQGLLMNFIGMLTDSRSLVSYTRHDYFRRILCNLIGGWVEQGEVPDETDILHRMVRNICHDNAERYFGF